MKAWNKIAVSKTSQILEVMKKIEENGSQFAMVVDDSFKLLGVVTDGDIRRGILKGIMPSDSVEKIMHANPLYVLQGTLRNDTLNKLREHKILHIPVLNQNGSVVGVESLDELLEIQPKENHVILMAGGLGARLGHLTSDCPKPMLKIGGRPILETIIENFKNFGFKNIYISVNYKFEMIEDYFGNGEKFDVKVQYIKETKKLGTAGSLSLYNQSNNLPIIVMNGDLLTKINVEQLLQEHIQRNNVATMCVRQYEYQVPYGVISVEGDLMTGIVEKPLQSFFVNGGIYVINPEILNRIPEGTYFDMPMLFKKLIDENKKVGIYPIHEYWLDIGRKDDFMKAHEDFDEVFK
jgi:dTDP-glucose pyrophosphorylase/predicted transcriptional regulator